MELSGELSPLGIKEEIMDNLFPLEKIKEECLDLSHAEYENKNSNFYIKKEELDSIMGGFQTDIKAEPELFNEPEKPIIDENYEYFMHCSDPALDNTSWTPFYQARHEGHTQPKDVAPVRGYIFKCDQCQYETRWKGKLKTHFLRHKKPEKIRMFKCDHCNYKTIQKDNLMAHQLLHNKSDKVFNCDQCNFQTAEKRDLIMHRATHKKPEERQVFKCDQCNYETFHKGNLMTHLVQHKKPKELQTVVFKCDKCSFITIHRAGFRHHALRHKNAICTFKCDQCNYKTYSRISWNRHLCLGCNK